MKYLLCGALLFSLIIAVSCNQNKDHLHGDHGDASNDNPNQALYDEVMGIHDEVMPKMEDLYKLKKGLQTKLDSAKDLAADKKAEIEKTISALDSASNAMMDWMHNFNPIPDSVDKEKAREYLESEMERIKKVKEITLEVIEKAKTETSKKQ
jgi:hypothetical protein